MVNLHTFGLVNTDWAQESRSTSDLYEGSDLRQTQDCPSPGLVVLLHTATCVSCRHGSHSSAVLKDIDYPSRVVRPAPCIWGFCNITVLILLWTNIPHAEERHLPETSFFLQLLRSFQGSSLRGTVPFLSHSCSLLHLSRSSSPVSVSLAHPLFHIHGGHPAAKVRSLDTKPWKTLRCQEAIQGAQCTTPWLLSPGWERCYSLSLMTHLNELISLHHWSGEL